MRINHNISALQTNSHMRKSGNALDKAMERLASGYKINRAADDSAGMAISRKMKTQIDGLERASMNGSDGISVIQTAEGALNEVSAILQRCRELAVQAANDTNTAADRASIQAEIDQHMQEIDRISTSTEYNTKSLLDGNLDSNSYTNNLKVELIYSSDTVPAKDYEFSVTKDPRQAVMNCESVLGDITEDNCGTLYVNDVAIPFNVGDSVDEWYSKVRNTCDELGIYAFFSDGSNTNGSVKTAGYEADTSGSYLTFVSKGYGSAQSINVKCDRKELADELGIIYDTDENFGASTVGTDAEIALKTGSGFANTCTTSSNGDIVTVKDSSGYEMKYKIEPGAAGNVFKDATGKVGDDEDHGDIRSTDITSTLLPVGSLFLQVGANENQTIEVKIPRVDSETLEIKNVNVGTHDNAEDAIAAFDKAINFVSSVRSKLGAYQNRLEHTVTNVDTAGYNMTEALSRIEDADMAEEMTSFTQQNVLQQAGTAMLAQANERPQSILSLLNG